MTKFSINRLSQVIIISLTVLTSSCSEDNSNNAPLRVGYAPWPGFDIVSYAQEAGLFKERDVDVELIKFESQFDVSRALTRGRLDGGLISASDLLVLESETDPVQIILVTNISHGSDGVVSSSGITDMKSLQGKRVGAKSFTINHLILFEALELHGLNLSDVEVIDVSNDVAYKKFINKELDAAVLWEPQLSGAATAVNGNVVFRTNEVDSLVIDIMAVSQQVITRRPDDLKNFLLAWFDIMQAVDETPEQVFFVVGSFIGQTGEEFADDYSGLKKGDTELNLKMFGQGNFLESSNSRYLKYLTDSGHSNPESARLNIDASFILSAIEQKRKEVN